MNFENINLIIIWDKYLILPNIINLYMKFT